MRKQKLSPEASKAKAVRDKKIAMTGHRKKRKRENERMGQRSDSDIHHTKDGKQVRVPIKDNRGNFGKGTKSEGPNMMGQTWLSRKINGPSAIGEGDKKKGGVKPYVTTNPNDPRIQAYSDSLSVHNQYENQIQPDYKTTSTSWNSKVAKEEHQKLEKKRDAYDDYVYELDPELEKIHQGISAKYEHKFPKLKDSKGVKGGAYENLYDEMVATRKAATEPINKEIRKRAAEVEVDDLAIGKRMRFLENSHRTTTNNQIKFGFNKPDPNFTVKGMKPEKWEKKTDEGTSYYTGEYEVTENRYGSVFGEPASNDPGLYSKSPDSVQYSPKFKKPTQKVILQSLEKMPMRKLNLKSTVQYSPKFKKPTYDPPRKFTSPTDKRYGVVNYGNKTGDKILNKAEFEAHKKLFKK